MNLESITFVSETVVSQEQFAAWLQTQPADDLNRYELLEGRIVMNPPAGWPEGKAELDIASVLRAFVLAHRLGLVFGPNMGYALPTGDTLAPDASFISRARWEAGPRPEAGKFLRIVPDLAVEVVSPSHQARDRTQKRAIYAAAGVLEYWIVDQRRREVTLFHAAGEGRFDGGRTLAEGATLRSKVLAGLEVPVLELMVRDEI